MTTFDNRERAFETLFAHDEDARFRALARRNKALAGWAATRMGLGRDAAEAYRDAILALGFDQGGDEALAARIAGDLSRAGEAVRSTEVRAEMTRLMAEAVGHGESS